ncbi:hypothetical protein Tco_0445535 [Tanacetum coccineum]
MKKHIENLKGKDVVEKDATLNNAKVIDPGMFKLDSEPLSPKLLKNKDAHIDYIKHTQENVNILRGLVKHARALRPLDSDLDSACRHAKRIQEVLVYVTTTCPNLTTPSEKLVAITRLNKNKKVRFAELATSSSNTQKQMSEQMSNHVTKWDKVNQETKTVNESLTAEPERYKERVKTFEQRLNVDLSSREKLIDSQMDDMIRNRNKAQRIKSTLYDGNVISKKHDMISVVDEKETLILEEES